MNTATKVDFESKTVRSEPQMTPQPILTQRLRLEPLQHAHAPQLLAYYTQNAAHLKPWEPARDASFLKPQTFAANVANWVAACEAGQSQRFVLKPLDQASGHCIGLVNFTHITPMPMLGCALGYGLDSQFAGQGLMQEALRVLTQHMFSAHGLHRIAANHMPNNLKSAATLKALGFEIEGRARAYLHINGRWEDHVLTALVKLT